MRARRRGPSLDFCLHRESFSNSLDNKYGQVYIVAIAGWSSPVARRAHNPKVAGSNPAPATKPKPLKSNTFRGFIIDC
jgi:hypothetical protein